MSDHRSCTTRWDVAWARISGVRCTRAAISGVRRSPEISRGRARGESYERSLTGYFDAQCCCIRWPARGAPCSGAGSSCEQSCRVVTDHRVVDGGDDLPHQFDALERGVAGDAAVGRGDDLSPVGVDQAERRRPPGAVDRLVVAGSPAMAAGPCAMRSPISRQSGSVSGYSAVRVAASAVSRPMAPKAAAGHGAALRAGGCGAWSVATAAIVPARSAATSAATSSRPRRGGLTLKRGSPVLA